MGTLNAADVAWVSRVPETSTVAQAMVREDPPPGNRARTGSWHGGDAPSSCRKARSAGRWCVHGRGSNVPG